MDLVKGLSLLSTEFWEALQPLWLGTVVMGLAMAVPSFIIIYKILVRRRQKDARLIEIDKVRNRQFNNRDY